MSATATKKPSVFYATGTRKTSSARIFLKPGSGKITINQKSPTEYFKSFGAMEKILSPFKTLDCEKKWDTYITVKGGGTTGQTEAIRHGLARALLISDESNKPSLKEKGFLTRDPRRVERKEYGLKKARRSPQFSKR